MAQARKLVGAVAVGLSAVYALVGVLAQAGRFSHRFDVLTHLAPLVVAGALLSALLALAAPRRERAVALLLSLVALIAEVALIAPEFLRPTGPTAPANAPNQIKIIEINAWRGNPHPERVVAWLQAENPDFVIMPEASAALRDLIVARTGWRVAGSQGTLMIFSHQAYTVMHRPHVPDDDIPAAWVNATYDSSSGPLEVVAAHMDWPTSAYHVSQGATLASVLRRLPRDRMVMAGDFNSTPWSFQRRRDDQAFGVIRRDRALATWPTGHAGPWAWPAPVPFLPIDHIYAGPGWATVSVKRGPRLGSDHYPVVAILAPVSPR